MVFKHDKNKKAFEEAVKTVASSLETSLGIIAVGGSLEHQHNRGLHSLVERAAGLAADAARQQSTLEIHYVAPGQIFDSSIMEDTMAAAEEETQEGNNSIVSVVLFPAVVRKDCDQGSIYVLKAKVRTRCP